MTVMYETERLFLITPDKKYLDSILDYQIRNRDFLEKWEPERPEDFYTEAYQKRWIRNEQKETKKLTGVCFMIIKKDEPAKVIGTVKLSGILYGNFCSCYLGYRLDKDECNNGYMTEAVIEVLNIAFDDLQLHRVEASIIPTNEASRAVLNKAGFRYIGRAEAYLKINGEWQDHDIFEYVVKP